LETLTLMKKQILILALFFVVALVKGQDSKNFIDQNYIEVTGIAYKEVVPDEIYLKIRIDEKDNKGRESIQSLERKMLRRLESIGIDIDKQVKLNDFSSNFQFYFLKRTDVFESKEYTIQVSTGAKAGEVITELSDMGISNVTLDRVAYSDEEGLKLEVKALAIKNAKMKAASLAGALDQTIGRAIHIQEYDSPRMFRSNNMEMKVRGAGSMNDQSLPEVGFEKIRVDASVQVKFILN